MPFAAVRGLLRRRRSKSTSVGADAGSSSDEKVSAARKKRRKKALTNTFDVLEGTLRLVYNSADAYPPLKSIVGGITHIVGIYQNMKGNRTETQYIMERMESLVELLELLPGLVDASGLLLNAVISLDSELVAIKGELDELSEKSKLIRFFVAFKEKERLMSVNRRLDNAVKDFQITIALCNQATIAVVQSTTNHTNLSISALDGKLVLIIFMQTFILAFN